MAIKGLQSKQLANNPSTPAPKFNFRKYSTDATFVNNSENIDFVTYDGSLYVCTSSTPIQPTHTDPIENGGFLLVVAKGEDGKQGKQGKDGADGKIPQIDARFNGGQLEIFDSTGTRLTTSPDLTGKVWKPVQEGSTLSWKLSKSNSVPSDIDLEQLRPVEEKPLLLRVDSDNTKRSDEESGPANMIQWKHEGDPNWTNLISIAELMNLTLAGVSVWADEDTNKWHFGHREVIKAQYESNHDGQKIISHVELGNVLFDAGELPFANYEVDTEEIKDRLDALEDALQNITPTDLSNYLTKLLADTLYQPKGNYLTGHQQLKTINGQSLIGTGDISISGGNVDLSEYVKTVNGVHPVNGNVQIEVGGIGIISMALRDGVLSYTTSDNRTIELGYVGGLTLTEIQRLIANAFSSYDFNDLITNIVNNLVDTDSFVTKTMLDAYATEDWVLSQIQDLVTGENRDIYRPFTLYQRWNSNITAPPAPDVMGLNAFIWDTSSGEIILDTTYQSNWRNHPVEATSELPYLWMATATFSYQTKKAVKADGATSAWDLACLTGVNGVNGIDGIDGTDGTDADGVEFAYILCTEEEYQNPTFKQNRPVKQYNDNRDDNLPVSIFDSEHPTWTDHPSGISPEWPIEVVSIRKQANGVWQEYSYPTIWSMWAEDGVDGDGVEYIYCIAAENAVTKNNGKVYLGVDSWSMVPTTSEQVEEAEYYQIRDWVPDGSIRTININGETVNVHMPNGSWTDNPLDIGESQPYEFVCIRKFDHETKLWGPFSEPVLWSRWAQANTVIVNNNTTTSSIINNFRPYKCWAFTRNANDLSDYRVEYDFSSFASDLYPNPTYAQLTQAQKLQFYDNPLDYIKTFDTTNAEVAIVWHDTVPATGSDLWMITNTIGDEDTVETGWDGPYLWGDSNGFQVEYSNSEDAAKVYPLSDNYEEDLPQITASWIDSSTGEFNESGWRAYVNTTKHLGVWSDEVTDPVYMATAKKRADRSWTPWTIAKIKGETGRQGNEGAPGEPGNDGPGVEIVFFALTADQYNDRSNFINTSNSIFVYDDDEYDTRTWQDDEYLPYIVLNGTNEKIRATDNCPGITDEKPYVFASTRIKTVSAGGWVRQYSGTATLSCFKPAVLWLAGDIIDYEYSVLDIENDSTTVLTNEHNEPVYNKISLGLGKLDLYHGNSYLHIAKIQVFVSNSWADYVTVYKQISSSGQYTWSGSDVTIPNIGVLREPFNLTLSASGDLWNLRADFIFIDNYVLQSELRIPIRVLSAERFISSAGTSLQYIGESYIHIYPSETNEILGFKDYDSSEIFRKTDETSTDYRPVNGLVSIVKKVWEETYNVGKYEYIADFTGVLNKNCVVKCYCDEVLYHTFNITSLYNDWYNNVWDNTENNDCERFCGINDTLQSAVAGLDEAFYIQFEKKFESDGHYLNKNNIWLWIKPRYYSGTITDNIKLEFLNNNIVTETEIFPIVYNGKNGTSIEVNGEVATSATMNEDELIFNDENEEPIGSLNVGAANALAENLNTNLLNWYEESSSIDNNGVVNLTNVSSIAKTNTGYINTTNTNGVLNVSLNVDNLVNDILNRLGGMPIVQTVHVESNNIDITGQYLHYGQPVTITGDPNSILTGIYTDDTYTTTVGQLDANGSVSGVVGNVDEVTITNSVGKSSIKVISGVNPGVVPSPNIRAAAYITLGYIDDVTGQVTPAESGYESINLRLSGEHSGANVTYSLHFSRKVKVIEIGYDDQHSSISNEPQDVITFSEYNENNDYVEPEILISFENIVKDTLMWVYGTVTIEYSGEDPIVYATSKKYFKTTQFSE